MAKFISCTQFHYHHFGQKKTVGRREVELEEDGWTKKMVDEKLIRRTDAPSTEVKADKAKPVGGKSTSDTDEAGK